MTGCYLTSLPMEYLRAVADFEPDWAGSYFVPRSTVAPPACLVAQVWPELDRWKADYVTPAASGVEESVATGAFLELLDWLRLVLLQDSVFFYQKYPDHPIFQELLFRRPEYSVFVEQVLNACSEAHKDSHALAIEKVVPAVAEKLRVVGNRQEAVTKALRSHFEEQNKHISELAGQVQELRQGFSISVTVSPGGTNTTRYELQGKQAHGPQACRRAATPISTVSAGGPMVEPIRWPIKKPTVQLASAARPPVATLAAVEPLPSFSLPRSVLSV